MKPTLLRSWFLGLAFAGFLLGGCGGGSGFEGEMGRLIEAEDWVEIRARVQVYHDQGIGDPWLDYAEGLALLAQNADKAAVPILDRAVLADSSRAPLIARRLAKRAHDDLAANWNERARRRMASALHYDSTVDPGKLADPVGDYFFRFAKDYELGLPLYRRLARELPEPVSKHPEWIYRYGYCLQATGLEENALEVYEQFRTQFPNEQQIMRFVQWREMQLRVERAERMRGLADPAGALAEIDLVLSSRWHLDLRQRARYLAGQIEEDRGDFERARDWYLEVLTAGGTSGGEITENASGRLSALGEMGVH